MQLLLIGLWWNKKKDEFFLWKPSTVDSIAATAFDKRPPSMITHDCKKTMAEISQKFSFKKRWTRALTCRSYSSWLTKEAAIQSVSNFISTFTDVITAAHCLRTLSYLVSFSGVKIWWPVSMCSSASSIVLKAAIQAGSRQLQVLTDIVFSLCLVFFCATRGIFFVQFPILSSQKERHFVHSKTLHIHALTNIVSLPDAHAFRSQREIIVFCYPRILLLVAPADVTDWLISHSATLIPAIPGGESKPFFLSFALSMLWISATWCGRRCLQGTIFLSNKSLSDWGSEKS